MDNQTGFKIRNKRDGLFSNGSGSHAKFTTLGKTWSKMHYLKAHLVNFKYYNKSIYNGCEVVEYELREISKQEIPKV